ncbi:MAG: tRNA (guanosine(46)-N7)-methyltransferase TrmB [Bacteroidota bacterium]
MPKDKLRRFAEYASFANTFDFAYDMKGRWKLDYFKNDNPLVLELGCGKGEYTVALAKQNPYKNFIGIDLKSNRMWKGAGIALEENLTNVAFMRAIIDKITEFFSADEVDEIWITFPDPYPKDRHEKHRLTSPKFLERYKEILKNDGIVHFKTDDDGLFQYTVEILKELKINPIEIIWDVHGNDDSPAYLREIKTYYEKLFMQKGRTVKYLRFKN